MQAEHAHNMPVFWGHGAADPTVQCVVLLPLTLPRPLAPDALPSRSYLWAEQSLDHLADMGFRDIEAHTYDGASPESLTPSLARRALTLSLSLCVQVSSTPSAGQKSKVRLSLAALRLREPVLTPPLASRRPREVARAHFAADLEAPASASSP